MNNTVIAKNYTKGIQPPMHDSQDIYGSSYVLHITKVKVCQLFCLFILAQYNCEAYNGQIV